MKKIIFLVLLVNIAFSSIVEVKKAEVVVTVNGEKQLLLKDDKIILNKNDSICIIKGEGKLVINNEVQISIKSREKCYKNFNDINDETLSDKASAFLDGSEESVSGMTRELKLKEREK